MTEHFDSFAPMKFGGGLAYLSSGAPDGDRWLGYICFVAGALTGMKFPIENSGND
jgi:hypothetical protein